MSIHDHPVRRAFDHVDAEPAPGFQGELRARLLADLERAHHIGWPDSDVGVDRTQYSDDGDLIELVGFDGNDGGGRMRGLRPLLTAAAAIVLVVGLAVVAILRTDAPVVDDPIADDAIARAALLTPDELGPLWIGQLWTTSADSVTWSETLERLTRIPACVPFLTGRPTATATFASTSGYDPVQLYQADERVTVFPSVQAAWRTMEAWATPAFAECVRADSESFQREKQGRPTAITTLFAAPPLRPHGDRQFALGRETTHPENGGGVNLMKVYVDVFVRVGRAIVRISPVPDTNAGDDLAGSIEATVSAAVDKLTAALAGERPGAVAPTTTTP